MMAERTCRSCVPSTERGVRFRRSKNSSVVAGGIRRLLMDWLGVADVGGVSR